jgi:hypothetical protein
MEHGLVYLFNAFPRTGLALLGGCLILGFSAPFIILICTALTLPLTWVRSRPLYGWQRDSLELMFLGDGFVSTGLRSICVRVFVFSCAYAVGIGIGIYALAEALRLR